MPLGIVALPMLFIQYSKRPLTTIIVFRVMAFAVCLIFHLTEVKLLLMLLSQILERVIHSSSVTADAKSR